jgi:hypothetical protein
MRNKDIKMFFATHEPFSLVGPVFDVYNFFIHEGRDENVDCYLLRHFTACLLRLSHHICYVYWFVSTSLSRKPLIPNLSLLNHLKFIWAYPQNTMHGTELGKI